MGYLSELDDQRSQLSIGERWKSDEGKRKNEIINAPVYHKGVSFIIGNRKLAINTIPPLYLTRVTKLLFTPESL